MPEASGGLRKAPRPSSISFRWRRSPTRRRPAPGTRQDLNRHWGQTPPSGEVVAEAVGAFRQAAPKGADWGRRKAAHQRDLSTEGSDPRGCNGLALTQPGRPKAPRKTVDRLNWQGRWVSPTLARRFPVGPGDTPLPATTSTARIFAQDRTTSFPW